MVTEKHKETAKEYFDSNPSQNVIHISSDGQVFFQSNYNDAVNHQRRIDEKTKLVTVYRNQKTESKAEDEVQIDDIIKPTEKWTNKDIAEWLNLAGVETTGKETKAALMAKVGEVLLKEDDAEEGGEGDDNQKDD